jgi:hypothetical protein
VVRRCFLAGRCGFEYVIFGRIGWPLPIGILVLAGIAVTANRLPPEVISTAATVVLPAVAFADPQPARAAPS